MKRILILIFACIQIPAFAFAQKASIKGLMSDELSNRVSEFYYSQSGNELLVPIRLLGGVFTPGIYHVPTTTDLTTLISIAGGIRPESNENEILYTRLGKPTESIALENHMEKGKEIYLGKGDIVFVPRKEGWITPETATTLTVILSIISTGLTVYVIDQTLN